MEPVVARPGLDRGLALVDPTGYRWANNTLLRVDRGSEYHNTQPVHFDAGFVLSRLISRPASPP